MAIILTILVKLLINGYYINYFGTYIKSFTNLLLTSESSIMKKKILLNITVWNDYVKKEVGLDVHFSAAISNNFYPSIFSLNYT